MLVTIGIAKCSGRGIRVAVEKPQSSAKAENVYSDAERARVALCNLGLPQEAVEYFLRLVPDLEVNQVLTFPPMDVP
jgi:hypothetical protein